MALRKGLSFRLIALFLGVFFISCSVLAQENREWKYCEQDSDCVVVGGGCCLSAVHKDFSEQGEKYCEGMNERVRCIRYMDPAAAKAVCKKTPVPCLNNDPAGCFSKKSKCSIVEQISEE